MARGIIYITTTVVDGLIKIGKTNSNNFEDRMYNLESNGYKNITGLKRYFAVEVDDYDEKESLMHKIFSKSMVGTTELFALDKDLAKQVLESFEGVQVYPSKTPVEPRKNDGRTQACNLTFEMLNIPVGAELVFVKDPTIIVKTVNNINQISYKGQEYSLTKLATMLLNKPHNVQGGLFWKYNNKVLTEIRKDMGL